ncbi:MAG: MTH1187 family thiamine-binding protein [Candidatus Omnitrophica bacterium]|nr:MTH1187 family thiamine-binding protein [Candidatus Omnitrophota bacterium]
MMLAELEIVPIGTGSPSLSAILAQVAKLIDQSGLDYRVGPMGTTVEGEWDRIMVLAKQCHQAVLQSTNRVMTTVRIDDRKDKPGAGRIVQKVQSLEAKVGKPLRK